MTARFSSASAYVQDAFLIAFVMLFIDIDAKFPLVLIWMGLSLMTAATAVIISRGKSYRPARVLFGAFLVMALAFAAGVSIITFIVLTILSLYRLHARFSETEDNSSSESMFMVTFIIVLTVALIVSILNPLGNSRDLLFPLAAAAIVFYTVSRLFYRYLAAKAGGAKVWQAIIGSAGILIISGGASFLIYLIADEIRQLAGVLTGGLLAIVLWPFANLLDWLVKFINGSSSEEEMIDNLSSMEEQAEQTEQIPYSGGVEFDYTIVAWIAVLLLLIAGIFLIRRIKPDTEPAKETIVAEVSRFSAPSDHPEETSSNPPYKAVDVHEIRLAYRNFETAAALVEKGRMQYETVREWALREELPLSESFFLTYDQVRYSNGQLAEKDVKPFLEEMEKINEKFLRKDV